MKYLGNRHCSAMLDCNDISYGNRLYIGSVKKVNCHFALVSSATKPRLPQTYFAAWYGNQNEQPNAEAVHDFHIAPSEGAFELRSLWGVS